MQNEFNTTNQNDLLSSLENVSLYETPSQREMNQNVTEYPVSTDVFNDPLAVFETPAIREQVVVVQSSYETNPDATLRYKIKSGVKFLSHYLAVS